MWDVPADLFLGSTCAACGRPGRALCRACREDLPRRAQVVWPTPCPPGLAPPFAVGEYADVLKLLVNAHKEHHALALAKPLGALLAVSVRAVVQELEPPGRRVLLVPVPSRAAVVRRRGHDALLRAARAAASRLRGTGTDAGVVRLLAPAARVADQAGLTASERAANLSGALRCRTRAAGHVAPVVVVDDVITTGATAREAQRALEDAGFTVLGVATVAATRRRNEPLPYRN